MPGYVPTDSQIASSPRNNAGNGNGRGWILSVRHARKVVGDHLFRSSRKYHARPQLSVAAVRGGGEIGLSRARGSARVLVVLVPGDVYICSPAEPTVHQFPKDIPGRRATRRDVRPCNQRDNRDKRPVVRRSLKRGHSYELSGNEERAEDRFPIARGSVSPTFVQPLQSGRTQRGAR